MHATAWRGASMLAAMFVAGCATPSRPTFELSDDCRLRSMPWGRSYGPTPELGFGVGIGGGGGGRPRPPQSEPRPSATSDGPSQRPRGDGYRGGGGAGFGFLGDLLERADASADFVPKWLADGPGFAAAYSNSCMPVRCFVRGGWPMVVDYTPDGASITTIEIHVKDVANPIVFNLDNRRGRHLLEFKLPDSLGAATHPAVLLIRSLRNAPGAPEPGSVQIHGLGAGPRAVGSVAIEKVDFQPPLVQRSAREQASFSFLSKSDFNHVAVSVLKVDNVAGQIKVDLAREFRFDGGISRGTVFGRTPPRLWDGTDAKNNASIGSHLLQVRAWMSARDEADWVTAWSERAVRVAE